PYYLYIPSVLLKSQEMPDKNYMLVLPNNTGKIDDNLQTHEEDVKKKMQNNAQLAELLKIPILKPVFPRFEKHWKIYTHALDRDTLITDEKSLARLDLQLIAMIRDATEKLAQKNIHIDKKVILAGFSASGMFVNRFALLHPDYVLAAAIGSPGGWPMLPVETWKDKSLRYPIGTADFSKISGNKFDLSTFKSLPLFFYLGDQDTNDSVVFEDGYEKEDKELVFATFGKTPVERWSIAEKIYQQAGCSRAKFTLYKGVGHTISPEMRKDLLEFLTNVLKIK
ncbi:MAG: hypothetical protein WAQ98_05840, partial [Blastocatellia bacterium]